MCASSFVVVVLLVKIVFSLFFLFLSLYSINSCQFDFYFLVFYLFPSCICCLVSLDGANCLIHIPLILREMLSQKFHLLCGSIFLIKTLGSVPVFYLLVLYLPLYLCWTNLPFHGFRDPRIFIDQLFFRIPPLPLILFFFSRSIF